MDSDRGLLDLLRARLTETEAPEQVARLVLAAYRGVDDLRAEISGGPIDLAPPDSVATDLEHVFLETITVAGFRGVGPETVLRLQPRPGLTVVVGRNGSGKSSFAEAVELALTGDSQRWADKHSIFRDGWRNLHSPSPCAIDVGARVDGRPGAVHIGRRWADDATDPTDAAITVSTGVADMAVQRVSDLGWQQPLDAYRPFLSANDLGRLISARPSDLFDALAPLLGIEPVTDADTRLKGVRKEFADRVTASKNARITLRKVLSDVDDERAASAANLLAPARPDLDAIDAVLARADDVTDPAVAVCRRLAAAADLPTADEAAAIGAALTTAAAAVAGAASERDSTAHAATDLLRRALEYHQRAGDGDCPVCGEGYLDQDWQQVARDQVERHQRDTAAVRAAQSALDDTQRRARGLLTLQAPVDAATDAAGVLDAASDLANAVAAWRGAAAEPLEAVATHIAQAYPPLVAAYDTVRAQARAWLQERHDAWREYAAEVQTRLGDARTVRADEATLDTIKAAVDWLKAAIEELRVARLAPFAAQSQHIWERLRQESNVELAGMKLDGTSTRRRVAFPATVDGTATSAMAVMSQGELQALGLAVFLPRACAAESPFRFLVVDDPVQSMDPSKVDGLAQVLAELAEHRQVVVFTHDNRLPETVRRLGIDATIWEVTRREHSQVNIEKNLDPVKRYLKDAAALAFTDELPPAVRGPIVVSLCRSAIEAACQQRIRADRIGRGERQGLPRVQLTLGVEWFRPLLRSG